MKVWILGLIFLGAPAWGALFSGGMSGGQAGEGILGKKPKAIPSAYHCTGTCTIKCYIKDEDGNRGPTYSVDNLSVDKTYCEQDKATASEMTEVECEGTHYTDRLYPEYEDEDGEVCFGSFEPSKNDDGSDKAVCVRDGGCDNQ